MLGLSLSSKLNWGSYIVSISKTASTPTKLETWFVLWSFFLLRLLFISMNLPHGLARPGAPSCNLNVLDKLQKQVWRTAVPSITASLEPLAYRRNVASLSITLAGRYSLNWLSWFHFLILVAGPLVVLVVCIFLSPFLDVMSMTMPTCQQFLSSHS